jgi:Na+-transporting methylmalonyl-CoA/oxaloacetate decarboxylase gamma subunit
MRVVFSVLSLLIVVAIIGVIAKKQLTAGPAPQPSGAAAAGVVVPGGTPKQQVDAVKQSVENALQQSRPVDDTK